MQRRERILGEGASALTDGELVAVLLGSGQPGRPVELVAARLAAMGLPGLRRAVPADLLTVPGMGEAQAARVMAALELGRRAAYATAGARQRLLKPEDLAAVLWPRLAHLPHEEFWAVLMTARLEEVRTIRIAMGGLTQCSILPREAFAPALLHAAPAIAFGHNHPSGDPSPSQEDHRLQLLLAEGARVLGVQLVDHLIVGDDGYWSAAEGRVSPLAKTG